MKVRFLHTFGAPMCAVSPPCDPSACSSFTIFTAISIISQSSLAQVEPRELGDPPQPLAQRVRMHEERLRGRADVAVAAQELLEREDELGSALGVVLGEARRPRRPSRRGCRRRPRPAGGTCRRRGPRRRERRARLAARPCRAAPAAPRRTRPRTSPRPRRRSRRRPRAGSAELAVDPAQPLEERVEAGRGELHERAQRSARGGRRASRARRAGARARARRRPARRRARRAAWTRSQPRRAARPSRSPRGRPPASSSKKSLIRFFSVSCSITCTFLIPTATWLATARPSSTRALPSATSRPISSPFATSGTASRVLRPPRASSGPSSARPSVSPRVPRLGIARDALELLAARIEEVDVARARGQERSGAGDDGLQELLERVRARDRLGQLGQLLELGDPEPRLLVQSRVLDRAGDERRRGDEEVDLVVRELPRRLGVGGDDADRVARAADDREREQRLEPLLLELGEVLRPRVRQRVVADEGRLAALRRPPGEALAALHDDLARLALVRRRGCAQHEALAGLVEQVREARMHAARVRHQPDDGLAAPRSARATTRPSRRSAEASSRPFAAPFAADRTTRETRESSQPRATGTAKQISKGA